MAFIPEIRMIANAWMRQRNKGTTGSTKLFLTETLEILSNKKVGIVRCVIGFNIHDFLSELEIKKLSYITAVIFYPTIKNEVRRLTNWTSIKDGIEISEFYYQST